MRRWLGRKLWGWSIRVWHDWHEIEVFDADGNRAATIGCYGQHVVTWKKPFNVEVVSERE